MLQQMKKKKVLRMQVSEQEEVKIMLVAKKSTQPASDHSARTFVHIVKILCSTKKVKPATNRPTHIPTSTGVGNATKVAVVSELRNNPQLSTDRLKRVRMNLEDTEQDNMYKLCPSDGRIVNEFITSLQVQQSTRRQQRTITELSQAEARK
ncbi:hypothetical protein OS493_027962 [Desmophyllum pertusum]|uniref:Uncharacterized protein n=1 Tax=Desmophyllum pertusum TaxID=174260 RepID=A0A9W9Y988_9CNID|nr:hypothetical protein OS493_027962 [Desmophyllum pertusum]